MRPPTRILTTIAIIVALVAIGVLGFFHVVKRTDGSRTLCSKESWSPTSTFVDMRDIIGRSRVELLDRAPLIRALERCEEVESTTRTSR